MDPAPIDVGRLFAAERARNPGLQLHHRTDTHWTEAGAALAITPPSRPWPCRGWAPGLRRWPRMPMARRAIWPG